MEDAPLFDPSEFQVQPRYPDIRLPPLKPAIPSIPGDPSKAPDFDGMKVKRGDIITADSVNEMVGVMEKLYDRVQRLEETVQRAARNQPGRVMEVEGIGREQWERLVKEGIVTLYDLGRRSAKEIMSVLDLESQDAATQIVTDAYALAGGRAGHPLTDLQSIGAEKAGRLQQAGIKNLGDFSTANPETIADALGGDTSVTDAEDMKRKAKSLIPRHAES
ncbi:MAG: hypothetical protein ABEL97_05065 [Salinibacter sp.]